MLTASGSTMTSTGPLLLGRQAKTEGNLRHSGQASSLIFEIDITALESDRPFRPTLCLTKI